MRNSRGTPHLLRSVWPLIAIVLMQAFLAGISMEMLASVRAYVAGESLWSKGLTEAVYSLSLYSETGDEKYYHQYQSEMAVPVGDRVARQALEGSVPDLKAAFDGFRRGGNHPDDIPDMIWLFRNFSDVSYLAKAIASWMRAGRKSTGSASEPCHWRSPFPGIWVMGRVPSNGF
jgi:hypothetical protein